MAVSVVYPHYIAASCPHFRLWRQRPGSNLVKLGPSHPLGGESMRIHWSYSSFLKPFLIPCAKLPSTQKICWEQLDDREGLKLYGTDYWAMRHETMQQALLRTMPNVSILNCLVFPWFHYLGVIGIKKLTNSLLMGLSIKLPHVAMTLLTITARNTNQNSALLKWSAPMISNKCCCSIAEKCLWVIRNRSSITPLCC